MNRVGEQCDLGSRNGQLINGKIECSATCQVGPTTTPGENPITYNISIPTFSKLALGHTIGSANTTKSFKENGMVIGKNANIFSLQDIVSLSMTPRYKVPVHIQAGKDFSISQENLTGNTKVSDISKYHADGTIPYWVSQNNTKWYVVGQGDFLMPKTAKTFHGITCGVEGSQFRLCEVARPAGVITLFKGNELQEFKGNTATIGKINLNAISDDGTTHFSLASFPVQVVNSQVSVSGGNRTLKTFTSFGDTVKQYISSIKIDNTYTSTIGSDLFANNAFQHISLGNIANVGVKTITSIADLEVYKYNANKDVFALKGDVTIACNANKVLTLSGVKTLVVEGNLHINCDMVYTDANASWAFIVKDGNITVDKDVKNISGVIVAVDGEIKQDVTTTNILRIDGTLYGKADNLFNKRTYARATSSYEILTTGTVITYSSRALRNPPPLLSQYLNTYKVQRVVR